MEFARRLKEIRQIEGYSSARAFFGALQKRVGVSFNYSYYMRVEKGAVLPSPKVLREITPALKAEQAAQLVLVYCQEMFPAQAGLFAEKISQVSLPPAPAAKKNPARPTAPRGLELSLRQVQALARSDSHYYLFLICTLSRNPFSVEEISNFFGSGDLTAPLEQLEIEKIIYLSEGKIRAISDEMRFPAKTAELAPLYEKFTAWDRAFPEKFAFTKAGSKFMIRRTTSAGKQLILRHHELLIELLRNSDDARTELLDEVMFFSFSLHTGKMPG